MKTLGTFYTTDGEAVQRADLDRAASLKDPGDGADPCIGLARAALTGDQAALDEFHRLKGLFLYEVAEYCHKGEVRLGTVQTWMLNEEETSACQEDHAAFLVTTRGDHRTTAVDAEGLVAWILSPEGRAALARRGISVPVASDPASPPLAKIQGSVRAEHLPLTLDRLDNVLGQLLEHMPEFEGALPLVEQLAQETVALHFAAREACHAAGVPWTSKWEHERLMRWMRGHKS